jgi:chromosome partitioning protein
MNVVITNLKGGVGKTTTAVYLAAVAVAKGYDEVLLIDADRQASSAEWLEERPIEGVTVVEAPSERTLARAMSRHEGIAIVDTPPGDERLVQSAINSADAVIIPTRAGGVEYPRVAVTLGMIPARTPRGILIASARPRLGRDPGTRGHRRRARGTPLPRRPQRIRRGSATRAAQALSAVAAF